MAADDEDLLRDLPPEARQTAATLLAVDAMHHGTPVRGGGRGWRDPLVAAVILLALAVSYLAWQNVRAAQKRTTQLDAISRSVNGLNATIADLRGSNDQLLVIIAKLCSTKPVPAPCRDVVKALPKPLRHGLSPHPTPAPTAHTSAYTGPPGSSGGGSSGSGGGGGPSPQPSTHPSPRPSPHPSPSPSPSPTCLVRNPLTGRCVTLPSPLSVTVAVAPWASRGAPEGRRDT